MISSLHHVAVICANYEKSRKFYTEVLELRVICETYRSERDSWKLDLEIPGGAQVELFSFPDPPARPSYPESCGLRHLAFAVQNLNLVTAKLIARGVPVEEIRVDSLTGKRFTFFADPDGLPIELYETGV